MVANASPEGSKTVPAELEKLASRPFVKKVRRNLQSEQDLAFCLRPEFVAGIRLLADFGFTFDLCIRHEQLRIVAELVRPVPQVTFVLDQFGKPNVRDKQTRPRAADLKTLAVQPNVVCKISGLTTEADWNQWQPGDLKFYFGWILECFGFDRALFGGDWPVTTLATNCGRWIQTVQDFLSFAKPLDQIKLFQTNAERIYHV
ncbi:MAG TPA: amidohydrolase family protein [Verrucomicrobiae bacterium]|nr:amidohydrolase family protein [Verrucomicrobiae bacterium]